MRKDGALLREPGMRKSDVQFTGPGRTTVLAGGPKRAKPIKSIHVSIPENVPDQLMQRMEVVTAAASHLDTRTG